METGFVPIRVRLSDEGDDEDYDASLATSENSDSASEHMATLSNMNSVSPSESFKEFFALSEVHSITLNGALRQLNELNSGVSSLDTSLLENTSEEGFRFRMMEITLSNHLSLDDEVVHDILNALLPVVRENFKQSNHVKEEAGYNYIGDMPAAEPTADDDDDNSNGLDDVDLEGLAEASDLEQAEDGELLPYSARGLPVRIAADDESEGHAVYHVSPSLKLPIAPQMAYPEVEACVLSDEMENQNSDDYEGAAQNEGLEVKDLVMDDNLLYGTKGGVVAGHSELVFVNRKDAFEMVPEEHPFHCRKIMDGAAKLNDEEEKIKPTAKRVLSLKYLTDPATGMPFLGNARTLLPAQPAGLGRTIPSLDHISPAAVRRINRTSVSSSSSIASKIDMAEGMDNLGKKLQMIGVKFLRLVHRLEQSARNVVVSQVLYRLDLVQQLRGEHMSRDFSLENLMSLAEKQEAAGQGHLDFECTILVLGKSGVGKSATLNSLLDEVKSGTDAYKPATKKVNEILGTVNGIKLRIVDTPGLLTSCADQQYNLRNMSSVKRYIKKSPPDIVLYFDRLDMQCRDYGDLLLLRTITDTLGGAIWYNTIVVLTHGSSPPPDGANGLPISYELFVAQRSHVIQQTIRQAAGDMRLINPVSLVENHVACQVNKAGHCVPPSGQVWKPQLLLLCFASKILAEVNTLMKLQDSSPGKSFWVHPQVPRLPFLPSAVLQSRAELKPEEHYDDLPPYRRLIRDELKLLDKEQRRLYHEELEYREKLFMKQQLKDDRTRKKELKRRLAAVPNEASDLIEVAPDVVPVTMPDMALPPSFDSGNPTHRYRFLDTASQWIVRPVLDTPGWDHDSGYDGLNLERVFVISEKIPVSVSGQITKDKKEASLRMECATSFKNNNGKITQAGLDNQTLGKDVLCTIRSGAKFSNFKQNNTTCGLSVTILGDIVAAGMKLEDCLLVGKRFKLIMNGGDLTVRKDVAYGGSLEASVRDKDYPIGRSLSTLGVSIMNWHGDLAIGGNLQLQFLLGKTMIVGRANLNNKKAGQISIKVSSSDQLQMAFLGLIPLLRAFIKGKISGAG